MGYAVRELSSKNDDDCVITAHHRILPPIYDG